MDTNENAGTERKPLTELFGAVEKVAVGFEEFKKVNDQMIEEERKGNEVRAKELADQLEKINENLGKDQKNRDVLQRKVDRLNEAVEILESLNDRPRTTVQDRMRGEHKDLFERWIRSGGRDQSAEKECAELAKKSMEVKDVSIGTTTAGGFAVPEEISNAVDKILLRSSPILQHVKMVRVGTDDYKELVSVNDAGYSWAAETTDRSANTDTPSLRERKVTSGELYAHPRTTNWALRDVFFNVEDWIVQNVAEKFALGISSAIWNGNGSDKPTGFINTAPADSADGQEASPQRDEAAFQYKPIPNPSSPYTTTGLTLDQVYDLIYALHPNYAMNALFAANRTTQGHLRKLKDSNGQYLWQPSIQAGQPDMLAGYPMFTWFDMGNPTTANAYPLAFGDFARGYTFTVRNEMDIIVDPYTTKGYTAFYVSRRVGGIVTNNAAIKLAKVAVS